MSTTGRINPASRDERLRLCVRPPNVKVGNRAVITSPSDNLRRRRTGNAFRSATVVLLCWLATVATPAPVWACCSSVWSCVATVATKGLSCVVEMSAVALRNMILVVETVQREKARHFAEKMAGADVEAVKRFHDSAEKAEKATKELEAAIEEARKIAGDDALELQVALQKSAPLQAPTSPSKSTAVTRRSGTAMMQSPGAAPVSPPQQNPPAPAYSAAVSQAALRELAVDNSLESMRRQLEEERRRGREAYQKYIELKQKELKTIDDSRKAAERAFQSGFLGRIDRLLADLQASMANPLNAPRIIEGAIGVLDGIIYTFDTEVIPAVEKFAAVAQASVANVEKPAEETVKHAHRARMILGEMRKSARFKTVAERRHVVGQVNAALAAPAVERSAPMVEIQGVQDLRYAVKTISSDLRSLRPQMQRLTTTPPPPDLRPAQAQVKEHFDQYFRGKPPSEGRKIRDQLIGEAHVRYGADPGTLAAVEKLINDEARARGVY